MAEYSYNYFFRQFVFPMAWVGWVRGGTGVGGGGLVVYAVEMYCIALLGHGQITFIVYCFCKSIESPGYDVTLFMYTCLIVKCVQFLFLRVSRFSWVCIIL